MHGEEWRQVEPADSTVHARGADLDNDAVRIFHVAASSGKLELSVLNDGHPQAIKSSIWNRSEGIVRDWIANGAINSMPPQVRSPRNAPYFSFFATRVDLLNLCVTLPELTPEVMSSSDEITYFWSSGSIQGWPADGTKHIFLGNAICRLGRTMFGNSWRDDAPNYPVTQDEPVAAESGSNWLAQFAAEREYRRALAGWQAGQVLGTIISAARSGDVQLYMSEYLKREYVSCPSTWWTERDWSHLLKRCSVNGLKPQSSGSKKGESRLLFIDTAGLSLLIGRNRERPTGVTLLADDQDKPLPPSQGLPSVRRRGRRPVYDWPRLTAEIVRIADQDGLDTIAGSQAELERWAMSWLAARHPQGKEPSESLIRHHVAPIYQGIDDHNAAKADN